MNPRSTDYEADALTTTSSRRSRRHLRLRINLYWLIKNWLPYIKFHFWLNNYPALPNKLASVKPKLIFCDILTTFLHKHSFFALFADVFKKIHQKLKYLNVYEL